MKKLVWIFIVAITLSSLCILTNTFITPIPDWLIRVSGIVSLVSIAVIAYSTAKTMINRSK